jgi:hypothetical protein
VSAGCSYHRAYIAYTEAGGEVAVRSDGWDGVRLGRVTAKEGGAIWKDCTKVAEGSLFVLMEEARKLGGNAIGEIRWIPMNPQRVTTDPTCKQKWGWFLIWPVLATPGFQSAGVEAYAYQVADPKDLKAGMYLIPDGAGERELLAELILSDAS